jgi:putative flippase GtrA
MMPSVKIRKFIISGASAAMVNILAMVLLVEVFNFKTYLLKNIANVLAIAVSVIYNFLICRWWTWAAVVRKKGRALMMQFLSFSMVNFFTMVLRAVLFAFLEKFQIFYVVNVTIGIAVAAILSFILYEHFVFRN